ncbi:Hypoxanthine/guanine phosphoribosyltransferase [Candidatus Burarchaeum australiense]|nr:Hypoxanthine/guanine phosphoribosyltransferase [Candidatus Burarchaeum australiense]
MNEELLKFLLKKNALKFGQFVLKSGRTSPYFFSTGSLDDGESLSKVGEAYAQMVVDNDIEFDAILGPAYKGIPLAVATGQALFEKHGRNTRMIYDRKEEKSHGVEGERFFVGNLMRGDRLLMIDDVMTTGYTKFAMLDKLRGMNMELSVPALAILMDREETDEEGKSALAELESRGVHTYSILKVSEVFEFLLERDIDGKVYVNQEQYGAFEEYNKKYGPRK